uniref:Proteasome inhibitor PI31 subunit n=1 Tax=Piliocolobus tephrosceles TaxID=591936 RepID=A0A8C9IV65_9PRIM
MAGLEVLFASAAPAITCTQDALVCFLHWEMVTHGYYGLGVGDQPGPDDKKSELLPAGWNNNKDLYVLRYEYKDGSRKLLVKAITVESSMILNVLEYGSQQVADLTLNLDDYIDAEHLGDFHRGDSHRKCHMRQDDAIKSPQVLWWLQSRGGARPTHSARADSWENVCLIGSPTPISNLKKKKIIFFRVVLGTSEIEQKVQSIPILPPGPIHPQLIASPCQYPIHSDTLLTTDESTLTHHY